MITLAGGTPAPSVASLWRRLAALAYEMLLVTALLLVAGFVMLPLVSPGVSAPGAMLTVPPLTARAGLFLVLFALLAAYFTWCWTAGRGTLAQRTWRIRIVRRDGGMMDRRTALARYLAAWTGPAIAVIAYLVLRRTGHGAHATWLVAFNFVWALIDRDRQFLHDRIAGTTLVDAPRRVDTRR